MHEFDNCHTCNAVFFDRPLICHFHRFYHLSRSNELCQRRCCQSQRMARSSIWLELRNRIIVCLFFCLFFGSDAYLHGNCTTGRLRKWLNICKRNQGLIIMCLIHNIRSHCLAKRMSNETLDPSEYKTKVYAFAT